MKIADVMENMQTVNNINEADRIIKSAGIQSGLGERMKFLAKEYEASQKNVPKIHIDKQKG